MAQIINTNIASLNAQRNLNTSQSSLATSLQRLSSGLRINSAKDDAAGLAIAERFTSQIRGGTQAARNANDGISLAQTAEGALVQVGNNLQRIRELAVQSGNATNSATDRAALQSEAAQLISEIDRIGQTASFNGVKLLDGTFTSQLFQVGANNGDTISIASIASSRTTDLGAAYAASVTGSVATAALTAGQVTINGVSVGASAADATANGATADSARQLAKAINAASGTNVTATANAVTVVGAAPTAFTAITSGDLTINGVNVGAVAAGGTAVPQGTNIANAINSVSAASGVSAAVNGTTGAVTLTAADGRNVVVAFAGASASTAITGLTAGTTRGTLSLSTTSSAGITVGGTLPGNAGLTAATTAASLTGTSVANVDLSSVAGANTALNSVDAALATINSSRASLGAYQNRFASVVASLQTTTENLTASRSRIQDADFAAETANLSRNQVLQQAGVAILAQANALPNQVLALLR